MVVFVLVIYNISVIGTGVPMQEIDVTSEIALIGTSNINFTSSCGVLLVLF